YQHGSRTHRIINTYTTHSHARSKRFRMRARRTAYCVRGSSEASHASPVKAEALNSPARNPAKHGTRHTIKVNQ
ncbi:MAG: hypothetical protein K2X38_16295, partial [Gemmataceae bacterium]|nr:hypothetical protein [Gemmataceae bacterium]